MLIPQTSISNDKMREVHIYRVHHLNWSCVGALVIMMLWSSLDQGDSGRWHKMGEF